MIALNKGSSTVKIYEYENRFSVVWYDLDGIRHVHSRRTIESAKSLANEKLELLSRGINTEQKLTHSQIQSVIDSIERIKPHTLTEATQTFQKCVAILGENNLVDACQYYSDQFGSEKKRENIASIYKAFIAFKESEGRSARTIKTYQSSLKRFLEFFGEAHFTDITEKDLNRCLKHGSERTINNTYGVLRNFVEWAIRHDYLPREFRLLEKAIRGSKAIETVETYSPEELIFLLNAAKDGPLFHFILIGAFTGARTSEIQRLTRQNIIQDYSHIEIPGALKTKSRARRLCPIQENLKQWLLEYPADQFLALKNPHSSLTRFCDKIGFTWKANALRHSYASYRLPMVNNDFSKVAFEMGNSPAMIKKHYLKLKTLTDSRRWFSIAPGEISRVVPLPIRQAG